MTVVTVFRSRLREGVESDYQPLAAMMSTLVESIDGFIDQKSYTSVDGERVTIVRFRDWASHRSWAEHADHQVAQRRGRDELYAWYDISVSEESYGHVFPAPAGP